MPEKSAKPIFYDPQNRRWRWFKVIIQVLGVIVTLIFCGLITSILTTPILPNLALAPVKLLSQQSHASGATPTVTPTSAAIILQVPNAPVLQQQGNVETNRQEKFGSLKPVRVIKRFHVSQKNPILTVTPLPGSSGSAISGGTYLPPVAAGPSPTPTAVPTLIPVTPSARRSPPPHRPATAPGRAPGPARCHPTPAPW